MSNPRGPKRPRPPVAQSITDAPTTEEIEWVQDIAVPKRIIDTSKEFGLVLGQNLPNHSLSVLGRGRFIQPTHVGPIQFRTRQSAYRFAGWLVSMAEMLPDEDQAQGVTFEEVLQAIRNT